MKINPKQADRIARLIRHRFVTGGDNISQEEAFSILSTPIDFSFEVIKKTKNQWRFKIAQKSFLVFYEPRKLDFVIYQEAKDKTPEKYLLNITDEHLRELNKEE